jgi:hypothetical protein
VVGLERGPLGLVSAIEELLKRKVEAQVYKMRARNAHQLTAICSATVYENVEASTSDNPIGRQGYLKG